jgi:alpha-beta hydrolase superfamily lysophospholipase
MYAQLVAQLSPESRASDCRHPHRAMEQQMPYFTTSDGTEIYYTDLGEGQPVILSHGRPLSSDAWQVELRLLAESGYRAIAHDRRGAGG